jgi:hypothetical protein
LLRVGFYEAGQGGWPSTAVNLADPLKSACGVGHHDRPQSQAPSIPATAPATPLQRREPLIALLAPLWSRRTQIRADPHHVLIVDELGIHSRSIGQAYHHRGRRRRALAHSEEASPVCSMPSRIGSSAKPLAAPEFNQKFAVEFRVDATRKETPMAIRPDPTFHASPKLAMEAPPEEFAYTALLSADFSKPDALAVIDVKPGSSTYSQVVHTVTMPYKGDEFHHFGWNACSSALSPLTGHAFLERRYLIIPGIRSSRVYVVDTKPHPTEARIHKIIEPEEIFRKTGYSRPHTVHCGPEGIYVSTLGGGGKDGTDGPPGVFIMDCETFEILGRWEIDRGPQKLHYDFWWNLPRDYMVSSEWGLPPQFENGIVADDLLSNK